MLDLVGNPEDRFSRVEAHMLLWGFILIFAMLLLLLLSSSFLLSVSVKALSHISERPSMQTCVKMLICLVLQFLYKIIIIPTLFI